MDMKTIKRIKRIERVGETGSLHPVTMEDVRRFVYMNPSVPDTAEFQMSEEPWGAPQTKVLSVRWVEEE